MSIRYLLAGGNGFIGSKLYAHFETNSIISSIDASRSTNRENSFQVDLTDATAVNSFVAECQEFDVLIFLVGLAHAKGKGKEYPVFRKVNYQTLINLLNAFDRHNKMPEKIIFSSTISVYGERLKTSIYREELEPKPFSPYAVTKLEVEKYLQENYAGKFWILRFAPVYSSEFMLNINRRSKIRSYFYKIAAGDKKLSLCNLSNIITAIAAVADDKIPSGTYNVSDSKDYTYSDLLEYQGAKCILRIPIIAIQLLYAFGKIANNIFLQENCVKLITDNTFPSDKIRSYLDLNATLTDIDINDN
jgi:nucleoside-diphosphate-sugar epimerase